MLRKRVYKNTPFLCFIKCYKIVRNLKFVQSSSWPLYVARFVLKPKVQFTLRETENHWETGTSVSCTGTSIHRFSNSDNYVSIRLIVSATMTSHLIKNWAFSIYKLFVFSCYLHALIILFPASSSDVYPSQHTSDAPELPGRVDHVLQAEGIRELQQRQRRQPHVRLHGHLTPAPSGRRLGGLTKRT